MPKLMQQKNEQFLLTIPKHVAQILQAKKGDKLEFNVDIKKQKVWLEKVS